MKTCTKCLQQKPESEYFVRDKKKGRLHAQCKKCYASYRKKIYKAHYEKYKDHYRQRAILRHNKLRTEYRTNMLAYMSDKTCATCGESDIRVLEFDHLDSKNKLFTVSQAVPLGYNWKAVLIEIKKCQILCSNCHKKRTAKQFNWYKA